MYRKEMVGIQVFLSIRCLEVSSQEKKLKFDVK